MPVRFRPSPPIENRGLSDSWAFGIMLVRHAESSVPDRFARSVGAALGKFAIGWLFRHFWLCSIVTELPAWPTRQLLNVTILSSKAGQNAACRLLASRVTPRRPTIADEFEDSTTPPKVRLGSRASSRTDVDASQTVSAAGSRSRTSLLLAGIAGHAGLGATHWILRVASGMNGPTAWAPFENISRPRD